MTDQSRTSSAGFMPTGGKRDFNAGVPILEVISHAITVRTQSGLALSSARLSRFDPSQHERQGRADCEGGQRKHRVLARRAEQPPFPAVGAHQDWRICEMLEH